VTRCLGARRLVFAAPLVCSAVVLWGCGYGPANAPRDSLGPFDVVIERAAVPDAPTIAGAAAGARAELARAGQLGGCGAAAVKRMDGGCAVVAIEVTRVDETGVGIAARDLPEGPGPRARGSRVTVTGRARVVVQGRVERETPDVAATETFLRQRDPAAALLARQEAARAASTRLGARLVRLLLGYPEPIME
jgi:hypothetical protein